MPKREKIHEALTAVIDDRININDNNTADVYSSDRKKKYIVTWDNNAYTSNDNATYWQGYPGYPVIGVLLIQNKLKYDDSILKNFKNINWKKLNTKFKNKYSEAVNSVYQDLKLSEEEINTIEKEIDSIYDQLSKLDIVIKKGKAYPPN
jgi:hypothetical protein